MLSIVIPTLDSKNHLPRTLSALVPGALEGLVKELVVVDGGSKDATIAIADEAGAKIITSEKGRGLQLRAGGEVAKSDWLLFLHADTVLADRWLEEVGSFIRQGDSSQAGVFRFKLDDHRKRARLLETVVKIRCRLLALPYGDQGLLISRNLYTEIGGFKPLVLMEDVDIISRIGRARLHYFRTAATTSAERYQQDGYLKRMARNAKCLALWYVGVAPEKILKAYE